MLGMPASRVRELAREALADLAPATATRVDPDWRGQVADYVLGQQTGPESTATRGHLKRSEPARAWAFSLLDSLSHLYPNGNAPAIPDADDRGAPEPPAEPEPEPEAEPATGDEARRGGARTTTGARSRASFGRRPVAGRAGDRAPAPDRRRRDRRCGDRGGRAADHGRDRRRWRRQEEGGVVLNSTSAQDNAYEVWLYNSNSDTVSLGAQFTDAQGNLQGRGDAAEQLEALQDGRAVERARGHQPQGAVEHRPPGRAHRRAGQPAAEEQPDNAADRQRGSAQGGGRRAGHGRGASWSRASSTSSCCRPPG